MVVNEKAMVRQMKEAYKTYGYTVAVEERADIKQMVISAPGWAVIMERKNTPPKVRGLIAEHLPEFPRAGEAYCVKKGEPQMEIYDAATSYIRNIHSGEKSLKIIKRTNLTLGGYPLWQRKNDLKIFEIDPEKEDIMHLGRGTLRIVGDEALMLDDLESRVYISLYQPDEHEQKKLDYLSKVEWVAG